MYFHHCLSVLPLLGWDYLLEPYISKSSLMHVVGVVYQDGLLIGVYHLGPEKNYLMTSGRLSIRTSISRWFPTSCLCSDCIWPALNQQAYKEEGINKHSKHVVIAFWSVLQSGTSRALLLLSTKQCWVHLSEHLNSSCMFPLQVRNDQSAAPHCCPCGTMVLMVRAIRLREINLNLTFN